MSRLGWVRRGAGPTNTTDAATVTTLQTLDLTALPELVKSDGTFVALNGAGIHVEAVLIGKNTSTGDTVTMRVTRAYSRINGSLTALGNGLLSIVAAQGVAGLLTCAATLDATGNSVRLRVAGVAATTIEWTSFVEMYSGEFTA